MTPNKKRTFRQYVTGTRKIWFIMFFSATAFGLLAEQISQSDGIVLVCCGAIIFSTFMAIFDR